ncbi:hypothetical protein [Mucilaginibacter sp. SP1R1]|uniref:hypothetical protein n=1 Tax=Mucilaginibacter sp. SP1R1 TaxID=2723091 RepID=UPI00161082BE|nr:hypothetical protein [Mucilaginibacter sp. SP1R1]MBB6149503.1 hypothetical protein [Mucilaginibacter sp. SP1R1]
MTRIEFIATAGDDKLNVEIYYDRWGSGLYMVNINKHSYGSIGKIEGVWRRIHANKAELDTEDVQILGAMVDDALENDPNGHD